MNDNELSHYSATCDMCEYVAQTTASGEEAAARQLSENLAEHNQTAHNQVTDIESIVEPVKAKMTRQVE